MSQSRLRVLLAEDNEDDVLLIRRALDRLDGAFEVRQVSTGEQVIPYLLGESPYSDRERHPFPDLLMMDHRMPRLNGLDVLFWLRTEPRFHPLSVVILTGGLMESEREAVSALKAAYVVKTVDLHGLIAAIERGIHQATELTRPDVPDPHSSARSA